MPGSSLTFDQVIKASKVHTTGFDYLRVGLALAVLCFHVIYVSNHALSGWLWRSWFAPFYLGVLPAFFVLSGFLVSGSLFRNSVPQFLSLRALRIFPALAVEITLSALVLGLLVTAPADRRLPRIVRISCLLSQYLRRYPLHASRGLFGEADQPPTLDHPVRARMLHLPRCAGAGWGSRAASSARWVDRRRRAAGHGHRDPWRMVSQRLERPGPDAGAFVSVRCNRLSLQAVAALQSVAVLGLRGGGLPLSPLAGSRVSIRGTARLRHHLPRADAPAPHSLRRPVLRHLSFPFSHRTLHL